MRSAEVKEARNAYLWESSSAHLGCPNQCSVRSKGMVDTRASYWIFSPLVNVATLASLSRLTTVYSSPYF